MPVGKYVEFVFNTHYSALQSKFLMFVLKGYEIVSEQMTLHLRRIDKSQSYP